MDETWMYLVPHVAVAVSQLSKDEALAQLICSQLGTDPRRRLGYDKVAALFTEENGKMHQSVTLVYQHMLSRIVQEEAPMVD